MTAAQVAGALPYEPPADLATPRRVFELVLRRDPCAYCAVRPSSRRAAKRYTVDHVEPRSQGGPNTIDNLVGACPTCNRAKGSHSLLLFLLWRGEAVDAGQA
ncbi:MAG: HNH endonuclease signature motif containing protein [Thermoleophilaceae bacterium]